MSATAEAELDSHPGVCLTVYMHGPHDEVSQRRRYTARRSAQALGWGYGVVVCSFDTDEYTPDCPKEEWGYLKKGVLIRSDQYGLIHYLEPEEGFELVRRAMNYA